MSHKGFKSMEFWRAIERENERGPSSSTKARSVPKISPQFGAGKSARQSQTFTNTGSASEVVQLRKAGKKWTSISGPPSNAPSRSSGAFRYQSMSAFQSSATWYTDEVATTQDDKNQSVKAAPPPLSTEKKRPHWYTETTTPPIHAPTVSVTVADSPSEERRDLQEFGPTVLRSTPSVLPLSSDGHSERSVLSPVPKPPPPKPPPPYRSTHIRNHTNQETSPGRALEASSSGKQLPNRAFSPVGNNSKTVGSPTLSPSQSMENLKALTPSLLSSSPGPESSSLLHIHNLPSPADLHSPSQLLSPVSPKENLFVTASHESMEEVAFSALLQRVLQVGDQGPLSNGQVPFSAPPRIQHAFPSSSSLSPAHTRHRTPSPTRVSPVVRLSRDELCMVVSSFYSKLDQFKRYVKGGSQSTDEALTYVLVSVSHLDNILHCTRVLCRSLLEVLPPSISTAVQSLKRSAEKYIQSNASIGDPLLSCLEKLEKSVEQFVADYCSYFHVGYQLQDRLLEDEVERMKPRLESPKVSAPLKVYIGSVCRLPKIVNIGDLSLYVSVCCGEETLTRKIMSLPGKVDSEGLLPFIIFNQWLDLGISLSHLPLESRLVFALLHEGQTPSSHQPLACGTVCLFLPNKDFWSGTHLLCLWPGNMYQYVCAGVVCPSAMEDGGMVLYMRLDNCGLNQPVRYADPQLPSRSSRQTDLSLELIQRLKTIVSNEHFTALTQEERDLLWESRHQLCGANINSHHTVPMLVRAMPGNSPSYRAELYALLDDWKMVDTLDVLALLTPNFSDSKVREFAVKWLCKLSDTEVTTFLPQIVQSLKCDWLDSSPTAEFLLVRAKASKEIAHHLYWSLHLVTEDPVYAPRYRCLWSALIKVLQKEHAEDLHRQRLLVESLVEVAGKVKEAKDKKAVLLQELREVERLLKRESSLPLDPAVRIRGLTFDKCSFFSSFTVPLKLSFKCGEGRPDVGVIFKAGDDLRQDMIVMQMIRLFDDMWKKAGLDLSIITYGVVATGQDTGMLEFVGGCETLREIQTTQGVTGSFKDHVLADWLMRHNPTKAAYEQAVETFTASCAGYCVASYVLGIGDRHNDNIMVTSRGHMFHIDYGKILGHAQMFGNIKRDRAPFVFTPDMAFVINGGGDKGANFQHFTDLCCTAYQELRGHTNLIINLLELMLPSGLPELSSLDDIQYVSQALLPGVSAQKASSRFTRLIEDSLSSVSTQINFVIHNLGQRKSGTRNVEDLLSFVPGRFSLTTDGAITGVQVTGFQKRLRPEKFYDYKVAVEREGGRKETIFRRYREFHEFNEKLKEACPGVQLPALPEKLLFQRSHVQQVSEQRQVLLNQFLQDVMQLPPAVSQCDLVYTFLHRMVRDEHDLDREETTEGGPEVKLDMKYNRTQNQVAVTVMHAKNLPQPTSVKGPPDPYVKLYVTPDLRKKSKQRTKVVESTHNPTYNETFFYPVGQDGVDSYALQVSVWTKSILGGKECLGQTEIKLHLLQLLGGISKWYKLSGDSKVVSLWSSTHPT